MKAKLYLTAKEAKQLINCLLKDNGPRGVITKFWKNSGQDKTKLKKFIKKVQHGNLRHLFTTVYTFNWTYSAEEYDYWANILGIYHNSNTLEKALAKYLSKIKRNI